MTTPATPTKAKSLPPTSTPYKKSRQGSEHYETLSKADAIVLQANMASELAGQWVGPMPVDKFISTFLPNPKKESDFEAKFFNPLEEQVYESAMYDPFIKLLTEKAPEIIKGFKLVNTSQNPDPDTIHVMKNKPDVSCYKSTADIDPAHPTRYDDIELIFEFKTKAEEADPFEDKPDTKASAEPFSFEAPADARMHCRGQIASYARVWCARQHRTHCFIVWIADPHARIIRIDRSGGIVSQRFDYRQNGNLLLHFLWSFCHSTDSVRGLDGTVTEASDDEIKLARDRLFKWRTRSNRRVLKIRVPDPTAGSGKTREFLVWCPLADPRSMTGRATRGYAAWDIKEGRVVFLKDSWRSTEPGMEKEVDILRELKAKGCRHIPEVLCGDDIEHQTTQTKQFANEIWNKGACAERLVQRSHTRFAEKEVGSHITAGALNEMTPKKFFRIVYHAFLAHHDAYTLCGILHRDISAGNILVDDKGDGFLNDWDLSRHISGDIQARQAFRSGTWQFMSSELLQKPDKFNTLQDDMESFFWLTLYHILRYMNHNQTLDLAEIMKNIFDSESVVPLGAAPKGGTHKATVLQSGLPLNSTFQVIGNPVLTRFYYSMRSLFREWYSHLIARQEAVTQYILINEVSVEVAEKKIPLITEHLLAHNHQEMKKLFEEGLLDASKWANGDFFIDKFPEPTPKHGVDEVDAEGVEGNEDADVDERPKKTPRRLPNEDKSYKGRSGTPGASGPSMVTRTLTKMSLVQSYDSPQS